MKWYIMALKKYAQFTGRSRRQEYWMFALFSILFAIAAATLDMALRTFGIIYCLYFLAILLPSLAVLVRRLHDTGKSGAWFFIAFVPVIGSIWLLVLMCSDSTPGDNQYGPNPKGQNSFNSDALDSHLTN